MPSRKNDFREEDKIRVLLWCARHCCLCGKLAGLGIEVAHLDPKASDIENAIPLCFDCHAAIGHYNARHPRGRKYSIPELRARRDQVYEEHTRHLVAPVTYRLLQGGAQLPAVHFEIINVGDTWPVRARVRVRLIQGARDLGFPQTAGHYDGSYLWNLNPRQLVLGNFRVPEDMLQPPREPLRARVDITLVDIHEREHKMLPGGYIHTLGPNHEWYFEPCEEELRVAKRPAATVQE
jgi:hypothetical protein